MDYEPKIGDWVLYSSAYGLKIGVVRYIQKAEKPEDHDTGPCHRQDYYITDDDRLVLSDILEIRSEVPK